MTTASIVGDSALAAKRNCPLGSDITEPDSESRITWASPLTYDLSMDSFTLAVVGAAYGTSVAIGISRRGWSSGSRPDRWLGGFIACGVTAALTIMLQHRSANVGAMELLERLEYLATLASGPMLLFYIRALSANDTSPRSLLHLVPAIGVAVLPAALSLPIELLVVHQMTYTGIAAWRRRTAAVPAGTESRLSWIVIAIMTAVHLAQIVRMAASAEISIVDVVPVTISSAILLTGLAAATLWIVKRPEATTAVDVQNSSRIDSRLVASLESKEILRRLQAVMETEHLYRKNDLGLHDLAGRVDVTPHELSRLLNGVEGATLLEFLTRYRLEDAKARLTDPGHDIYTIEGIGEMSGFGSRSSFHAIFRREVGTTPSRFRASR